ncbi:MAG: hypothetical protein KatS3mg011_2097 [Acidimicrobiia bacterium]|nr:MAG: hypothetical protein KatS3mg011_2097 [Acidimicrobiia bacterium]
MAYSTCPQNTRPPTTVHRVAPITGTCKPYDLELALSWPLQTAWSGSFCETLTNYYDDEEAFTFVGASFFTFWGWWVGLGRPVQAAPP